MSACDSVPAAGAPIWSPIIAFMLGMTERWGQLAWHLVLLAALATLAAPTLGGAAVARRGQ